MLEAYVFSKPYFDRHDLIIAEHGDDLLGFVHVGFGPNEQRDNLCREMGTTCMVMVVEDKSFGCSGRVQVHVELFSLLLTLCVVDSRRQCSKACISATESHLYDWVRPNV